MDEEDKLFFLHVDYNKDSLIERDIRQARVGDWVEQMFGTRTNAMERVTRFLEEALELAQAEGMELEVALRLAFYVFGRTSGDPAQEAGGAGLTLLAYCDAKGISADTVERAELLRVLSKSPESMRRRHREKTEANVGADLA